MTKRACQVFTKRMRFDVRRFLLPLALVVVASAVSGCSPAKTTTTLPSLSTPVSYPPSIQGASAVNGPISSPGGPYLYDKEDSVVMLHGVNAVYKFPPYELYGAPGKSWNFDASDACR